MNVYVYQADLWCEDCGRAVRKRLKKAGRAPADPDDESSYDSDDFPKGPFPDGGGESECGQFCCECGVSLENPVIGGNDDGAG